jgi:hypothetical protein
VAVSKFFLFGTDPCSLIQRRSSVRSFRPEALPDESRTALVEACRRLRAGPLGTACRFRLLDRRAGAPGSAEQREGAPRDSGERLGTYGVVRGAPAYLIGAAAEGPFCLPDFGYLFELLVLRATDLGLGTCWLGGTFRRGDFARALGLEEREVLPAVSPVGIPAGRRGLVDRVFRLAAGSKARRPWDELFFDASGRPLEPGQEAEPFRTALEMVRLAPSASNRQPWRLVRDSGATYFFLRRTPGYARAAGADLQKLDMGIAMAHFELALRARTPGGADGAGWALAPRPPGFHNLEYVVSWQAKVQAS